MKLFTYCENEHSEVKLPKPHGVKQEEYTYEEYLSFLKEAKKYYIYMYHYYYETDMSDYSTGSSSEIFSINYNNMIIKDHKLYGVLVFNSNVFPDFYFYKFNDEEFKIELEGGYNSNSFTWSYKKNNLNDYLTLNASATYLLIKEVIKYKEDNPKEVSYYNREIINLTQNNFIVENEEIVGIKYNGIIFKLDSKITTNDNVKYHLIKINPEFLEKNIMNVYYKDFQEGNYKILDEE